MFAGRPTAGRKLIHCPPVILYVWLSSLKLFTSNKHDKSFSKLSRGRAEWMSSS